MIEPESIIIGKQPPYVRSFRVNPHRSNGKNEKEVTIEYVILQENRSAFIDSLPYTLTENALTPLFSAEDIATHGIISSAYSGLDLQGVQESGEGRLRTLTITYATPQDDSSNDSSDNYSYSWWSSSGNGKIFHERARILLSESESYARAAMQPKYGLSPNGASISPDSDGTHATYEASWGPNDENDIDEEGGGSGGSGGDGGSNDDEEDGVIASSTDSISVATSTEVIVPGVSQIAKALGVLGGDGAVGGGQFLTMGALIESGQLVYRPDALNGGGAWYSATQDPVNSRPFSMNGVSDDTMLQFVKMVNSKPSISVPKMTVTVRRYVKSITGTGLSQSSSTIGVGTSSLNAGGITLPAPSLVAPAPFNNCALKVLWVYCGRGMDTTTISKRYSNKTNSEMVIYGAYITDTYTTQASFE